MNENNQNSFAADLAIVITPACNLRKKPGEGLLNDGEVSDQIFSGWAVRRLPEGNKTKEWTLIETHYGYTGYVLDSELKSIDAGDLKKRQDVSVYKRTVFPLTDILNCPKVQGAPLEKLPKNSFVELMEDLEGGWSKVLTASGTIGYLRTANLQERKDNDLYLINGNPDHYFLKQWEKIKSSDGFDENLFRERVVEHAMAYMGAQYRWGGKSALGIDCSGLVFMSYIENGVFLYRDADMKERYPAHQITKDQLQKGDMLFFPGHVALCIGGLRFIHATAYAPTPYVTINSLDPEDPLYRKDLDEKLEECGSLF